MEGLATLGPLTVALAVGLLVGLEREWRFQREGSERHAGVRTFGLIALAGGVAGALPESLGLAALAALLLGLPAHFVAERLRPLPGDAPDDVTTVAAAMVVTLLGALSGAGEPALAAICGVVVAALLNLKPTLHRWIAALSTEEIHAVLLFLVISLVVLPTLPDRTYDPWDAINPYRIWWMVVLISGLSFAGYAAVRIVGPAQGRFLTALLGGLVSSTAVTASLAGVAREHRGETAVLAAGIGLACAVMAVRVALVAGAIAPAVGLALAWPMGLMALAGLAAAGLAWRRAAADPHDGPPPRLGNPIALKPAFGFAALIALIGLLARILGDRFGEAGLYALAAVSGLADVDAITIAAAQQVGPTATRAATGAIVVAVAANTLVKTGIAWRLGGASLGRRVAAILGAMLALAFAGLALPAPIW